MEGKVIPSFVLKPQYQTPVEFKVRRKELVDVIERLKIFSRSSLAEHLEEGEFKEALLGLIKKTGGLRDKLRLKFGQILGG